MNESSGPPPLPVAGASQPGQGKRLGLGAKVGLGVLILLGLILCVALETGMESSFFPSSQAQGGNEIPGRIKRQLMKMGIVDQDEEIQFFYSTGAFSIREDGNLFTDRRVISYEAGEGGKPDIYEATYPEIENIEMEKGSWIEDSLITIATIDDGEFYLLVSAEGSGDQRFLEALQNMWKNKRGDSK